MQKTKVTYLAMPVYSVNFNGFWSKTYQDFEPF